MPPRRSGRLSVEPSEPPSAPPSGASGKRKRAPTAEPDGEDDKPARGARKPSTARASTARSASRKTSLQAIQASDDEDEAPAPPKKRSRPSTDSEEDDYKQEEDVKPARTASRRAAGAAKPTAGGRKKKEVEVVEVSSDDDDAPPSRYSRASRGRGKAAAPTRKAKVKVEEVIAEDDEEDAPQPAPAPAKARRGSAKPVNRAGGRKSAATPVISLVSEDESSKPASGSSRRDGADANGAGNDDDELAVAELSRVEEDEEEDEDIKPLPPSTPRVPPSPSKSQAAARSPTKTPAGKAKQPDYEEEHSLLDIPYVSSGPSRSQPAPPPEEPKGPQKRLVIYKMVLVNFKSYAGRQEIGPFHKASRPRFHLANMLRLRGSPSLQLSARTVRESQTRSTRSCSCSDTGRRRCARANSLSLYTTRPTMRTSNSALLRSTSVRSSIWSVLST
jgi:structural maintenance of chromosome 4